MRSIGQLASKEAASRFSDYLFVRGIENEFEAEDDGRYSVWILEDNQVAPASQWLQHFLSDPNAPEYTAAQVAAERMRVAQDRAEKKRRSSEADVARIQYEKQFRPMTYVTFALIVLSIATTIYTQFGAVNMRYIGITEVHVYGNYIRYSSRLPEILHGEVWRLITPIFLHLSFIHILFNMMMLKDLGIFIETRFGPWYFATMVLVSAALSNLGQFFWSGPDFGGFSGVVYALFGFLWIRGKFDPRAGWELNKNTVYMLIGWFFLCMTGLLGPIANACHGVGLVTGMAWGYLSATSGRFSR